MKELKQQLRTQLKQARAHLPEQERALLSKRICEWIISHPEVSTLQREDVFLTYMPMHVEVDIKPILEWGWSQGLRMLLPRVELKQKRLQLYEVKEYAELKAGYMGILEPSDSCKLWLMKDAIHVGLVPGLAFDRMGRRLGYGGGYYDKLVQTLKSTSGTEAGQPYLIAAAYGFQMVDHVPTEPHDLRVHDVVTEAGSQRMSKTKI